LNGMKYCINVK